MSTLYNSKKPPLPTNKFKINATNIVPGAIEKSFNDLIKKTSKDQSRFIQNFENMTIQEEDTDPAEFASLIEDLQRSEMEHSLVFSQNLDSSSHCPDDSDIEVPTKFKKDPQGQANSNKSSKYGTPNIATPKYPTTSYQTPKSVLKSPNRPKVGADGTGHRTPNSAVRWKLSFNSQTTEDDNSYTPIVPTNTFNKNENQTSVFCSEPESYKENNIDKEFEQPHNAGDSEKSTKCRGKALTIQNIASTPIPKSTCKPDSKLNLVNIERNSNISQICEETLNNESQLNCIQQIEQEPMAINILEDDHQISCPNLGLPLTSIPEVRESSSMDTGETTKDVTIPIKFRHVQDTICIMSKNKDEDGHHTTFDNTFGGQSVASENFDASGEDNDETRWNDQTTHLEESDKTKETVDQTEEIEINLVSNQVDQTDVNTNPNTTFTIDEKRPVVNLNETYTVETKLQSETPLNNPNETFTIEKEQKSYSEEASINLITDDSQVETLEEQEPAKTLADLTEVSNLVNDHQTESNYEEEPKAEDKSSIESYDLDKSEELKYPVTFGNIQGLAKLLQEDKTEMLVDKNEQKFDIPTSSSSLKINQYDTEMPMTATPVSIMDSRLPETGYYQSYIANRHNDLDLMKTPIPDYQSRDETTNEVESTATIEGEGTVNLPGPPSIFRDNTTKETKETSEISVKQEVQGSSVTRDPQQAIEVSSSDEEEEDGEQEQLETNEVNSFNESSSEHEMGSEVSTSSGSSIEENNDEDDQPSSPSDDEMMIQEDEEEEAIIDQENPRLDENDEESVDDMYVGTTEQEECVDNNEPEHQQIKEKSEERIDHHERIEDQREDNIYDEKDSIEIEHTEVNTVENLPVTEKLEYLLANHDDKEEESIGLFNEKHDSEAQEISYTDNVEQEISLLDDNVPEIEPNQIENIQISDLLIERSSIESQPSIEPEESSRYESSTEDNREKSKNQEVTQIHDTTEMVCMEETLVIPPLSPNVGNLNSMIKSPTVSPTIVNLDSPMASENEEGESERHSEKGDESHNKNREFNVSHQESLVPSTLSNLKTYPISTDSIPNPITADASISMDTSSYEIDCQTTESLYDCQEDENSQSQEEQNDDSTIMKIDESSVYYQNGLEPIEEITENQTETEEISLEQVEMKAEPELENPKESNSEHDNSKELIVEKKSISYQDSAIMQLEKSTLQDPSMLERIEEINENQSQNEEIIEEPQVTEAESEYSEKPTESNSESYEIGEPSIMGNDIQCKLIESEEEEDATTDEFTICEPVNSCPLISSQSVPISISAETPKINNQTKQIEDSLLVNIGQTLTRTPSSAMSYSMLQKNIKSLDKGFRGRVTGNTFDRHYEYYLTLLAKKDDKNEDTDDQESMHSNATDEVDRTIMNEDTSEVEKRTQRSKKMQAFEDIIKTPSTRASRSVSRSRNSSRATSIADSEQSDLSNTINNQNKIRKTTRSQAAKNRNKFVDVNMEYIKATSKESRKTSKSGSRSRHISEDSNFDMKMTRSQAKFINNSKENSDQEDENEEGDDEATIKNIDERSNECENENESDNSNSSDENQEVESTQESDQEPQLTPETVQNLSDKDLRFKIKELGGQCGPISKSLRKTFEKKLIKLLSENKPSSSSKSSSKARKGQAKSVNKSKSATSRSKRKNAKEESAKNKRKTRL